MYNGGAGYNGGTGGDGGGVVYIAADSVTVSGTMAANGNTGGNGVNNGSWGGGGGGGGAGGSVKIVGNTLALGATKVTATAGSGGAGGASGNVGGAGGVGRIAASYATSISGNTSPVFETASTPSYNYSVFISDEIATPNATEYDKIRWIADLTNYGNIELQTRSGKTSNSTDNTWETWKPNTNTNNLYLENADTHTNWVANRTSTTTYSSDNLGDGSDGAITVSSSVSINTNNLISGRSCVDGGDAVNYSVTGLTSTTATIESAPSAGCLSVGDEVLLINFRGNATAYGNVGNWETLTVSSIASNVVTFTAAKTKYYGDGASDDTNVGVGTTAQAVMLQRVPNYTTVTVNASINFYPDDWVAPTGVVNNGAGEGGVMFFRATGAVTVNGTIHANGKGYVGTTVTAAYGSYAYGGEAFCAGTNAPPTDSAGAP